MFESPEYPQPLDEDHFDEWLERGRASKIPYEYMLVVWDEGERHYYPIYLENLSDVYEHGRDFNEGRYGEGRLIAAYHLFSESKVNPYQS